MSETVTSDFKHRDEFTNILRNNLVHSTFKTFKVYDRKKLHADQKILRDISQEQIISNIVEQAELCKSGEDFQDIFVTAPTGAGKSVMFQVPAIYLAEKYNLLTIVISPLIALMNDQIKSLELKNYQKAKTINSDISPILKKEITYKVASGECNVLYISPETLLSRNGIPHKKITQEISFCNRDIYRHCNLSRQRQQSKNRAPYHSEGFGGKISLSSDNCISDSALRRGFF